MSVPVQLYRLGADLVLLTHFLWVLFVVLGLVVIWVGHFCKWPFVRNVWFRAIHLLTIGIVVAESLGGLDCPLTIWEDRLRLLAGGGMRYETSFLQYWLHRILFFEARAGVFTLVYVLFFGAVLLSVWWVPPDVKSGIRRSHRTPTAKNAKHWPSHGKQEEQPR